MYKHPFFDSSRGNTRFGYKKYIHKTFTTQQVMSNNKKITQ
jgi:hypothetical protein